MTQPPTPPAKPDDAAPTRSLDFIRTMVQDDVRTNKWNGRVNTRFPPEPNGYLHIGHAKSICLNFGIAKEFGGKCNLRFDDTNPTAEEQEYVDSIKNDVKWLGWDWEDRLYFASDYFERMYEWAVDLIRKGKAFVCDLTGDQMSEYRGTVTRPGRESPFRNRSVAENLDLFGRMRKGEFPDGSKTLRAKIDMGHANMNLRDPVMYRILHATHHNTGDQWCVYPMYDWAHGLEDSIEGITHSICTLEFEDHRPLYNWYIEAINEGRSAPIHHPQQIEFARLELTYTVMSKRKLLELVREKLVGGWDDPRMPTISGLRRRGVPAEAIREFCERIGVAKSDSTVDMQLFEHCVRDYLNKSASRVMAVIRPLKIVLDNYPDGQVEIMDAANNPENPASGTHKVPFSKVLYIEKDDFREDPPKQFFRLAPGREVRLRYGYFITCQSVVKDPTTGEVMELHCTYDPATRGGDAPDGRKVKATLHWVAEAQALRAEVRLYDHLFSKENPNEVDDPSSIGNRKSEIGDPKDWKSNLNTNSLETVRAALVEPSVASARPGDRFQFERVGYFCVDQDSTPAKPIFNRTVTLKDAWAKIEKKSG